MEAINPWQASQEAQVVAPPSGEQWDFQDQQKPNLLEQATKEYPILQQHNLQYKESFGKGGGNKLEFWPANEPGDAAAPRPKEFDIAKPGVEVYDKSTRPIDIAGDAVSHHLIHTDPTIKAHYDEFAKSITPQQEKFLQGKYEYAKQNAGETRDYKSWREIDGLPSYFRGHPFQQWPKEFNDQVYTPQQRDRLDQMMKYMRGGK